MRVKVFFSKLSGKLDGTVGFYSQVVQYQHSEHTSRGVGKGIAMGLGEAGATVYITGRTTQEGQAAVPLPGTIHETAAASRGCILGRGLLSC